MKNKAKVFEKGRIYKGGGAEIKNGICFYGLGYVFFSSDQQTHWFQSMLVFYFLGEKTSLKFHLLIFYWSTQLFDLLGDNVWRLEDCILSKT